MTFKEFVNAGAFSNTAFRGLDSNQFVGSGHALNLPTPTLDMPTRTIHSTVRRIVYNENPISIQLMDGTIWNLTKKQWDYLKSTNKEPKINSNIQIEMFLDGTIKSVNIEHHNMGKRLTKTNFGGPERSVSKPQISKADKIFGKSPF